MGRIFPEAEHQTPLAIKYETAEIWSDLRDVMGVKATGAAIAVALYEARLLGNADGLVSYSRNKNYYDNRQNHRLLSYRKVVSAVDSLDAGGWIEHYRQSPGGRGWQSAMCARDELMSYVRDLIGEKFLPLAQPVFPVLLRNKDKLPLAVPSNRLVRGMASRIGEINEGIGSLDVQCGVGVRMAAPVVRIFNSSMERGGRFYGCGSSWQNIRREMRSRITIDGEATVELDYSTLHPAMLYAEVGHDLPVDCYRVGFWPRPLVKLGLLVLINADSLPAARLKIAFSDELKALGLKDQQTAIRAASQLIAEIKAAHQPIAGAFHSDAGGRLMRADSEIAERVQLLLHKKNIVALPVHDSFLVPASRCAELEDAMAQAAHEAGLANLKITQK